MLVHCLLGIWGIRNIGNIEYLSLSLKRANARHVLSLSAMLFPPKAVIRDGKRVCWERDAVVEGALVALDAGPMGKMEAKRDFSFGSRCSSVSDD
jgi:hypothetical protein